MLLSLQYVFTPLIFFMDNKEDIAYLTSMEGKQNIVNTHVEGIIQYIKEYEK